MRHDPVRACAGAAGWLHSLDVNPLVLTADGFVAVDAYCLLKPEAAIDG